MSIFRSTIPDVATEEPMVQLLGPDGTRTPHEQLDAVLEEADLATPERLRGYYRDMVMIRAADLEATSLQRQGQLGLWASALGQEAAQDRKSVV